MSLRAIRRWSTARAVHAAGVMAPWLPERAIDAVGWWLSRAGPTLPVLSRIVAANMRSAGVYGQAAFRAYFAQVALHLSNALRIFRLARQEGAVGRLARAQVDVDDSLDHLRRAIAVGRGAVVAPAHVCNYLLTLVRLNQEVPLWVYLRWSADERRRELKQAWCRAAGLRVILEPPDAADPTSRAAACVEALRDGKALVMTPDIAQKADEGVAVELLGRRVYLPTGPASIAMLAEAPLIPVFGRLRSCCGSPSPFQGEGRGEGHGDGQRDASASASQRPSPSPYPLPHRGRGAATQSANESRHVIYACPPIMVERLGREAGGRHASIQRAMQAWAGYFEAFLTACPQAWFLWADSRWTRVFCGDPRYSTCGTPEPRPGAR